MVIPFLGILFETQEKICNPPPLSVNATAIKDNFYALISSIIDEKGNRFLNHIFTDIEQRMCNQKSIPKIHYSGKYAAKEAVKKALLSSKTIEYISLKSIEINNDYLGEPIINVNYNPYK